MAEKGVDWGAALTGPKGPEEPEVMEPEIMGPMDLVKFDTQPAALIVVRFKAEVKILTDQAALIRVIKDNETNKLAVEMGLQAKKLAVRLEKIRKDFVEPHNLYLKEINNFFHEVADPLTAIVHDLGRKTASYRQLLENERLKQEAAEAKARKDLQDKLDKEAAEATKKGEGFKAVTILAPVTAPVPTVTRTEEGSASQRKKWVCKIVDPTKIPFEYCRPDQRLLDESVRNGVRAIPGCEIYQEFITQFRA